MKKNMLKMVFFVILFGIITMGISAQASNSDQRIVGTWVSPRNDTWIFNANGTTSEGTTYGLSVDRLIVVGNDTTTIFSVFFSPDGRTMILAPVVNGQTQTLVWIYRKR